MSINKLVGTQVHQAAPIRAGVQDGSLTNAETQPLPSRASQRGAAVAYRFLPTGDVPGPTEELSYEELERQAHGIAAALQKLEAQGERALLLYPPGLEFIAAFFGCLFSGTIAVP